MPKVIELARYIDRFGGPTVLGRAAGAGELRRMVYCENLTRAYYARARAEDWVRWADANEDDATMLNYAMKLAGCEDGE